MSRRFSSLQYTTIVILVVTCVFLWARKFNLVSGVLENRDSITLKRQDNSGGESDIKETPPEQLNGDVWGSNQMESKYRILSDELNAEYNPSKGTKYSSSKISETKVNTLPSVVISARTQTTNLQGEEYETISSVDSSVRKNFTPDVGEDLLSTLPIPIVRKTQPIDNLSGSGDTFENNL